MEMGRRAKAVVELVKARTRHESVEVADYQNGLMLLSTTGLALYDVLLFLLTPVHNVLINLIGLHYCLFHLGAQVRLLLPLQYRYSIRYDSLFCRYNAISNTMYYCTYRWMRTSHRCYISASGKHDL